MAYSNERLNDIYDRTDGYCHLCGRKLAFSNYASFGSRGAWEVEHSVPRSRGGTERRNNLFAACISCNRSKGGRTSTRSMRSKFGRTRAPYSRQKKDELRAENAAVGGLVGAGVATALGAHPIFGAVVGALLGHSQDPELD
ncbi:HNH endonuclease [Haliangium ochraceum]|uniref:HNH endonuclease n=1 Tax=Haliangium ochraceum TaxID=80816 RepID=UPI0005D47CF4|nr:HNH endonuclease [Haliangium ochraceum]